MELRQIMMDSRNKRFPCGLQGTYIDKRTYGTTACFACEIDCLFNVVLCDNWFVYLYTVFTGKCT